MDAYSRYGPALLRKAERMLQNREDARDVVQALFLDLLQSQQLAGVELPMLYRAVTNRCLNLLRDRKNRARLLAQSDPALRGPARVSCDDHIVDIDLLAKLVSELDAESCEIVIYRFVDDLTQDEIAELMRLSRKTIGKRLDHVRDTVRRLGETDGGAR